MGFDGSEPTESAAEWSSPGMYVHVKSTVLKMRHMVEILLISFFKSL